MPKTIFDTCRPRRDVQSGVTKDEQFAADLAQVVNKTAPTEYLDPAVFFRHSYPTRGLQTLLKAVCERLNGESTISPVIRLHTQYGGGKTHGLIALVHAVRGMEGVGNADEFISRDLLPKQGVRIAALDGENSDPCNGRVFSDGVKAYTLWGELAHDLAGANGYELVRKGDEQHTAPGAETLRQLFGGEPTLIILDEISVYLRKAEQAKPGSAKQFTAFIHALIKAVDSSPNVALVLTLALNKDGKASDAYAEENDQALKAFGEAESVISRKCTQLNPTGEDETAQVLRTRLFEHVDGAGAAEAYAAYLQTWESNRSNLPPDFISRDEFIRCYPIHPHLLSMLTEKTSSLSTFQRTRGMLRLLARTVHSLWKTQPQDAFVVHTHHIDPGFEKIRDEITVRLGQAEYMAALRADVAELEGNSLATAQVLDAKLNPGQLPAVSYVARTVFLHSLAFGDAARGIRAEQLRFSVCSPLLEPAFIEQARTAFISESLYLDDRPGAPLRFMAEPNLTMVIRRQMNDIQSSTVREKLFDLIQDAFKQNGGVFSLCQFPAGAYQVPDNLETPQLVVMNYETTAILPDPSEIPPEIEDIFQHKGNDSKFREFKNNLVFLLPDERSRDNMLEWTRKLIALDLLKKSNPQNLPEHQRKDIAGRASEAKFKSAQAIVQCYRHLFYPFRSPMSGASLPLAHQLIHLPNERPGIGQLEIVRTLEEAGKLVDAKGTPPTADYVRDTTPLKNLGEMTTAKLRDEFRILPKFPILTEDVAFKALVRKGIADGVFIYREGAIQITGPGDPLSAVHINDNCFVMTMDYAKAKHFWPRPEPLKVYLRASATTVAPGSTVELIAEVSGGVGPYAYKSSIAAFQHSAATTQNVLSTRITVDATKTFSVEVTDHLGNQQTGSVWVQVSKEAGQQTVVDFPPQPKPNARPELTAEGPLLTALKEIWDKARRAKVEKIQNLKIRMIDSHAVWRVHGAMVNEKTAAIACNFDLAMAAEGVENLLVNFTGTVDKSANIRSFLEPVMKQASHKDFQAIYTLRFPTGLHLSGSDPEKLTENLTKYGGTEAYVEAHAEDEQKEVAA